MQTWEKQFLLGVIVLGGICTSSSLVINNYISTTVAGVAGAQRFSMPGEEACREACSNKGCPGYNFNPQNFICQFFELVSAVKPKFTCARPVPIKLAACPYKRAAEGESCRDCQAVLIEEVDKGVRAKCAEGRVLVFYTEITDPKYTTGYLTCTLKTRGWKHEQEELMDMPTIGCTVNAGTSTTKHVTGADAEDQTASTVSATATTEQGVGEEATTLQTTTDASSVSSSSQPSSSTPPLPTTIPLRLVAIIVVNGRTFEVPIDGREVDMNVNLGTGSAISLDVSPKCTLKITWIKPSGNTVMSDFNNLLQADDHLFKNVDTSKYSSIVSAKGSCKD